MTVLALCRFLDDYIHCDVGKENYNFLFFLRIEHTPSILILLTYKVVTIVDEIKSILYNNKIRKFMSVTYYYIQIHKYLNPHTNRDFFQLLLNINLKYLCKLLQIKINNITISIFI